MVSNIFHFHPYLGKWSNLTNIFSNGLKPPTSDLVDNDSLKRLFFFRGRELIGHIPMDIREFYFPPPSLQRGKSIWPKFGLSKSFFFNHIWWCHLSNTGWSFFFPTVLLVCSCTWMCLVYSWFLSCCLCFWFASMCMKKITSLSIYRCSMIHQFPILLPLKRLIECCSHFCRRPGKSAGKKKTPQAEWWGGTLCRGQCKCRACALILVWCGNRLLFWGIMISNPLFGGSRRF